jgi:RNA-directed DNA polymerase
VKGERCHAEQLREEVAAVLARIGLRLSPAKTQVFHIDECFDFLGFHIRQMRKRGTTKSFVYTKPSKRAIASIKGKVRTMTYRSNLHMPPADLLRFLGRDAARVGELLPGTAWPKPPSAGSIPTPGNASRPGCGANTGSAGQH